MNGTDPRPCTHPRADHQHGTNAAYVKDRCRCDPCRTAQARASKGQRYRHATGTGTLVPADRARAHVHDLLVTLTIGQVERRSGVNRTAIRCLLGTFPSRPRAKRITRSTEAALLAVRPDPIGPETNGLVNGVGTRRRYRALIALGYPAKHLNDRLGLSSRTSWYLTSPDAGDYTPVTVTLRAKVTALYDAISMTPPPPGRTTTVALNSATRHGWAPPLAWDDDTIDDPYTEPAPLTDDTPHRGDDLDEFLFLLQAGETTERACERLAVSLDTVLYRAGRDARDDVLTALTKAAAA